MVVAANEWAASAVGPIGPGVGAAPLDRGFTYRKLEKISCNLFYCCKWIKFSDTVITSLEKYWHR